MQEPPLKDALGIQAQGRARCESRQIPGERRPAQSPLC